MAYQPQYGPPGGYQPQPQYGAPPPQYAPQPYYPPPQPVVYQPPPAVYSSPPAAMEPPSSDAYVPLMSAMASPPAAKKCCGVYITPETKERFSCATLVIGAILSLVLLVMSILAYIQINGFVNDYENVVDSWKTSPITSISVSSSCTGDSFPLTSSWPGLYDACDCTYRYAGTNSTDSDDRLCTTTQLNDGCLNRYSGFKATNVEYFGSGARVCLKRSGPSAINRKDLNEDGTCPTGHRVCGVAGSGTIDNRICWPTTEANCPVTDIGILATDLTLLQAGADGKQSNAAKDVSGNWVHLYWKNGGVLNATYFGVGSQRSAGSQQLPGLPIVNVAFQANNPCTLSGCGYSGMRSVDLAQSNRFKVLYPREGWKIRSRCSGGCTAPKSSSSVSPSGRDIRYIQVATIKEQDLFNQYPADIPAEFRTSDNSWLWYISAKTETEWARDCPRARSDVIEKSSNVTAVRSAQLVMLLFSILSFIVLALYFPIMKCTRPDQFRDFSKCNCCLKVFFKVVTLVCTIITVVLALGLAGFWSDLDSNSASTSKIVCSDPLTSETFNTLSDIFSGLSMKNKVNTASSAGDAALHVIENWFSRCF